VLEDQELPFCRLEEDLIGIVALDGPGNWLASRDQADNDFFALELGDKPCFASSAMFVISYLFSMYLRTFSQTSG
jgi:hypothetical protein